MAEEEEKPKFYEKQLRIFVGDLNTQVGSLLVELLYDDNTAIDKKHIICGKLVKGSVFERPKNVQALVEDGRTEDLIYSWLHSDVIIYDLNTANHEEVELAIKTLKFNAHKTNKRIILISSVMVWAETPPKEKGEGDEEDEPDEQDEEDRIEEEKKQAEATEKDGEPEEEKKVYVSYKETDFIFRRPLAKYENFKTLESLAIATACENPRIETFIICSGIMYGLGENVFYDFFKKAWLQNPLELAVVGQGLNYLPMVHIKDLVMFVKLATHRVPKYVANPENTENPEKPKRFQYLFAIDHSKKRSLKQIVRSISKGVGTGNICLKNEKEFENNEYYDMLTLNLKLKPSQLPDKEEEEEAAAAGNEDAPKLKPVKFEWWCRDGLAANIQKIKEEFNSCRKLKPNKIYITGPPVSGKTYLSKKIAEHYNLPHLKINNIIDDVKKLGEENELFQLIDEELRNKRVEMKTAYDEEREKLKKKKAKIIPPEKDENMFFPKLSDEALQKIVLWRLSKNDCLNRGFVLDGFPKTYKQCKEIFMMPEPEKEGDPPQDSENPKLILNPKTCPESDIFLKMSYAQAIENIFKLPEEIVHGTHWTEADTKRRYLEWEKNNYSEKADKVLEDFFIDNKIEIKYLNMESVYADTMAQIRNYVDRFGRFNNYQAKEIEEEKERQKIKYNQEQEIKAEIEKKQKELKEKETQIRRIAEEEHGLRIKELMEEDKIILEQKSSPLKEYLTENVLKILGDGILKICQEKPEDPVDYLAEYLFEMARTIPLKAKGNI